MPSLPPVTQTLIIVNVAVYLAQSMAPDTLVELFALWPVGPGFFPWQVVTYGFLHGSLFHLLFNMLALWMFGSDIERVFGQRRYFAYYFSCVLTAALAQLIVAVASGSPPY